MEQEIQLEKAFQEQIMNNIELQRNIIDILNLKSNCIFEREVEFINGITSDFLIRDRDNIVNAVIECKRADIGVTEYVRGVGQLFQYEYFQDEKIKPKKFYDVSYKDDLNNNVLVIPSSFIRNTKLNIGRFRYPKNATILEVHEKNHKVREITKKELEYLAKADEQKLHTISQYYVRDIRLFETYILLQVLSILNQFNYNTKNRTDIELNILRKFEVINNKNWRNAFITLSSLGFITSNKVVASNAHLVHFTIEEYINHLYEDYLYPFIDELMIILLENSYNNEVDLTNKQIADLIREKHQERDVLFLTDSDNRYISSWLNIMRDDLGCISFKKMQSKRLINYIPKELASKERMNKIKSFSTILSFVDVFSKEKTNIIKEVL